MRRKKEKSPYSDVMKMVLDVLPCTEKDFKSSGKAGDLLYEAVGFWKDIDLCQIVKIYRSGNEIRIGYAEGSKVVSLARTPHEESDDEQQDNTQAESEENKQEISTEKENNVEKRNCLV